MDSLIKNGGIINVETVEGSKTDKPTYLKQHNQRSWNESV